MKVLSAIVVFVWTFVKMIVAGSCAVLLQLFGFVVGTVVKIAELTWGATKFIGCMVLLLSVSYTNMTLPTNIDV